ncbi:hypothetical protein PHSC3_001293 [Chlamydiales bacterium STE3]|nr:hypothetical protein PHSC3_001293 [Chlamydiales bacterium STE3]
MASVTNHLDFSHIWNDPLKTTLVLNVLNGHKVAYDATWKVDGKAITPKHPITRLFWRVLHWFKSCCSNAYKKRYNQAVRHLMDVQKEKNVVKKTSEAGLVIISKNDHRTNLQTEIKQAEEELHQLANDLLTLESSFAKDKSEKNLLLADYQTALENLKSYQEQRKKAEQAFLSSFFKSKNKQLQDLEERLRRFPHLKETAFTKMQLDDLSVVIEHHDDYVKRLTEEIEVMQKTFCQKTKSLEEQIEEIKQKKEELMDSLKLSEGNPRRGFPAIPGCSFPSEAERSFLTEQKEAISIKDQVDLLVNAFSKNETRALLKNIEQQSSPQLALLLGGLLHQLFSRSGGAEQISSIDGPDKKGIYTLILKKPLRFWIDTKDKQGANRTPGGAIFTLGDKKHNKVEMKFSKDKIEFLEGFETFATFPNDLKIPEWIKKQFKHAQATIFALSLINSEEIVIRAGKSFPIIGKLENTKPASFSGLNQKWSKEAELVPDKETNASFIDKKKEGA